MKDLVGMIPGAGKAMKDVNIDDDAFQGVRNFDHLDLVMTVGTSDLDTYIKVNEPITGIVQERPHFTNINNGII